MCTESEYAKMMGFPSHTNAYKREKSRERYAADPEFRERRKAANRARYANNPAFREHRKARARDRHAQIKAGQ